MIQPAPDRREFLQRLAGAVGAFAIEPGPDPIRSPFAGDPLRVGLVGAGRQGRAIVAELQKLEQVRVAAVCDVVESRVRSGQRRAADAKAYGAHGDLLADDAVQAVIVATPTHLHRQIALDALAAGKHVYCEAPLAHTLEDARAIARAARGARGVFHAGFLARSNPIYQLARSFLRSGALRDLVSLRAQDHQRTSWRVPAAEGAREQDLNWRLDDAVSLGLPGELGAHQFDAFHWFLDACPASVRGSGGVRFHQDGRQIADTVLCELAFQGGLRLSWQGSLCSTFEGRHEVYTGSMAALKLAWTAGWMFKEADAPTQGWEVYANRESFGNDEGITLIADATKLAKQGKLKEGVGLPQPPLWYGLADFARSALEGKPPACSAEDGYRATVVGILAQRAVAAGEEQKIEPALLEVG